MSDLSLKRLEGIISSSMLPPKCGRLSAKDSSMDEILACLYLRLSRSIETYGFMTHENLILICDGVFNKFEVNIDYDRNRYPDSDVDQLKYIINCLNEIEQLQIKSVTALLVK